MARTHASRELFTYSDPWPGGFRYSTFTLIIRAYTVHYARQEMTRCLCVFNQLSVTRSAVCC